MDRNIFSDEKRMGVVTNLVEKGKKYYKNVISNF